MDKATAETVVKVYAVLYWIGAALGVLGALAMLLFSLGFGGFGMMGGYGSYGMMPGFFGGFAIIGAVIMIALSIFGAIVGFGLWNHQAWARVAALVFSVLGALSIFSLNIIGAVIGGVGIWLFGFEETVKGLFTGKQSIMDTVNEAKKKISK